MSHRNTLWGKKFCRADNVVHRKVAGEELLVPIRGELADMQRIFTLNAVGGFVWSLLDGEDPLETVAEKVFDRFAADRDRIASDLQAFVSDLEAAGLAVEA